VFDCGGVALSEDKLSFSWEGDRSSLGRVVASLDRKRLGADCRGRSGISIRGVFDKETRRKPLAFAADAVRYGI
jgi:hypothetical protein